MTKEQRRLKRDLTQPKRKEKPVKIKRSKRCQCPNNCEKHGRFNPL